MPVYDILYESYLAITANKTRSGLTMLGIVIGISSVIVMLAIGQGAQKSIQSSIESIGSNLIIVMPGAQRGPGMTISSGRGSARSLKNSDANALTKELGSIVGVEPEVSGRQQVTAPGTNTNTQVVGTVPNYELVRNTSVAEGVFLSDQNISSAAKVAVLGPTVRDDLFGEGADAVGQTIRIKKINFKVIGVTASKGGSGFGSQDDMIFVPLTAYQRFISGDEYLSTIYIAADSADSATAVVAQTNDLLLSLHKIKDPLAADFSIMNQADIVSMAGNITQIFTLLLGSVAGISLIVGGIGIMNMMLTTVTERMREIGLRKAIGAKRRDISRQFLLEAVVLTFSGGAIGIALGWLVSFGIAYFGLLQTSVSFFSILLAFGVSTIIGISFGYYPARRASRLNPIDALRYE